MTSELACAEAAAPDRAAIRRIRVVEGFFYLAALFSSLAVSAALYLVLLAVAAARGTPSADDIMGLVLGGIGLVAGPVVVVAGASVVLQLLAARAARARRRRRLCLVAAGVSLLGVPVGTLLGAIALAFLLQPRVAYLFDD